MGPFPHDAPAATIDAANPAGTDGFEFVEFAHPEPGVLEDLFRRMGYVEVARHRTKDISVFRQGDINYLVNREPVPEALSWIESEMKVMEAMQTIVADIRKRRPEIKILGATLTSALGSTSAGCSPSATVARPTAWF